MISALLTALAAPSLRRYIARRVGPDDVDDVLQEVALSALRALPRYEDRGYEIRTWLYMVAHNRCVDYQRRHARHPEMPLFDAHSHNPYPAIESRADAAWLWPAVDALPANQRAVIRARYADDLSIEETAARLGISPGAVKSAQWRGIDKLRGVRKP